ncbi:MAG TPA: TrmH family RNA methyltransferase [Kofleriaceae bacterium]|jgi:hypothetical protein
MFDWQYRCIDRDDGAPLRALTRQGVPIIAIENAPGAEDLFKYRPPAGRFAVVVGNERKGISRRVLRLADRVVQIPMASAQVNTLNVAAAAAIAIYALSRGRGAAIAAPRARARPEVLLAGATDPVELGSAVRSAACFGWSRVRVHDDRAVWFTADRVIRSLGRGAARRGRNPIRVVPLRAGDAFNDIRVITARGTASRCAAPIWTSGLASSASSPTTMATSTPPPSPASATASAPSASRSSPAGAPSG